MSLSARREGAGRAARSTGSASTSSRPASPSSNPKEDELFELLADVELENAEVCAFGMTRRRELARRGRPGPAELVGSLRAGRHPGRQDLGPPPREGDQGLARGEPGDDRRLGRASAAGRQARGLRRRALLRRLARRPRATRSSACGPPPRPAPRTSPSATPTARACRTRSPRRPPTSSRDLGERRRGRDPHPQRRRVRRRQLARRRRAPAPGWSRARSTAIGERCGNANLVSILPALQLKLGYECVRDGAAARC